MLERNIVATWGNGKRRLIDNVNPLLEPLYPRRL
jgi:hypothetical protein